MKRWTANDWVKIILALSIFILLLATSVKIVIAEPGTSTAKGLDTLKILVAAIVGGLFSSIGKDK